MYVCLDMRNLRGGRLARRRRATARRRAPSRRRLRELRGTRRPSSTTGFVRRFPSRPASPDGRVDFLRRPPPGCRICPMPTASCRCTSLYSPLHRRALVPLIPAEFLRGPYEVAFGRRDDGGPSRVCVRSRGTSAPVASEFMRRYLESGVAIALVTARRLLLVR